MTNKLLIFWFVCLLWLPAHANSVPVPGQALVGNGQLFFQIGNDFSSPTRASDKPAWLSNLTYLAGVPVTLTLVIGSSLANWSNCAGTVIFVSTFILPAMGKDFQLIVPVDVIAQLDGPLAGDGFNFSGNGTGTFDVIYADGGYRLKHGNYEFSGVITSPEPGTLFLLGTGLASLGLLTRRFNH